MNKQERQELERIWKELMLINNELSNCITMLNRLS